MDKQAQAWRIKVEDGVVAFDDAIQGATSRNLSRDIGDFVLKRADGLYAYQLAVVVDDAEQGITHILRGADLLDSTSRQIYLQQKLGFDTPSYAHIPVAANQQGEKLSKQTLAQPVEAQSPIPALWQALDFLGQKPETSMQKASLSTLWEYARANWNARNIPRQRSVSI